ncbi:MAG: hypothetical protein ACXWZY_05810, partial [Gaiellaceae bacterium]
SRRRGAAPSTLLRETEVFGFMLGARTGRGRTGRLGDTDRVCAGITRSVRARCPELANRGRLGLPTKPLGAAFVVAGSGLSGAGRTSAPDVGSVSGATGASRGSVVGETTLVGAGASELPGVLATGASGSEIGTIESSDAPQVVETGA